MRFVAYTEAPQATQFAVSVDWLINVIQNQFDKNQGHKCEIGRTPHNKSESDTLTEA